MGVALAQRITNTGARATDAEPVLDGHDEPVVGDVIDHLRIERHDHARVVDRRLDALCGQQFGRTERGAEHLAEAEERHRAVAGTDPPRLEAAADLVVAHVGGLASRPADGDGAIGEVHGIGHHLLDLLIARRREDRHAGDLGEQDEVEDAVV